MAGRDPVFEVEDCFLLPIPGEEGVSTTKAAGAWTNYCYPPQGRKFFGGSIAGVSNPTLLIDGAAAAANIRKALQDTLGAATPDDVVIFSFSGHGSHDHRLAAFDTTLSALTASTIGKSFNRSGSVACTSYAPRCARYSEIGSQDQARMENRYVLAANALITWFQMAR